VIYIGPVCNNVLKNMGILRCMAFCAELLNLILTKEVDEVQNVRGVF
jgi:hypothetical protein